MERWRYKLWESTWLFLYRWNESMNPSADQKREIEETAMGPIERDVLASPGRHKEANGAQGTAPEAPEPWGLTAAPTEPTGEPPMAQGGGGLGAPATSAMAPVAVHCAAVSEEPPGATA